MDSRGRPTAAVSATYAFEHPDDPVLAPAGRALIRHATRSASHTMHGKVSWDEEEV